MKKTAAILLSLCLCALLCACSGGNTAKPLSEVWSDIKEQVDFEDFLELSDADALDRRYGITEDMATEFAGGVNSSGTNQEEIVLVKATDDESAKAIKEKLDKRYESKLAQNKNYNPEQAAMTEKCKVERNGLYVSMIVSPEHETIEKIFRIGTGQ